MANTQALCSSFKVDVLNGYHAFNTTTSRGTAADTYKAALFLAAATLNASTTGYTSTNEVPATGSYVAGGPTVTWLTTTQSNSTGTANGSSVCVNTLSANITVTTLTATAFDTVLIYNSTMGNRAVSVHTFGSQTITQGTFTLTMPTNAAGTALIQIT